MIPSDQSMGPTSLYAIEDHELLSLLRTERERSTVQRPMWILSTQKYAPCPSHRRELEVVVEASFCEMRYVYDGRYLLVEEAPDGG